jgi:hypothetical protein
MIRLPLIGRALLLGLALPLLSPLTAAPTTPPTSTTEEEKVADLVRKLGSDNYDTREEATQALAELGRKVVKALEAGTHSEDMEIVRRCTELLDRANRSDLEVALDAFLEKKDEKLLLQVPAWSQFKKVVGDGVGARNLFVQMCTTDGLLLTAMEQNADRASQMYNQRCQQLQQRMFGGFGNQRQGVTNGEVAAMLYVGADSRIQVDPNLRYIVNNLVHQPAPQQWLRSDGTARKLLASYIEGRSDINLIHNHLYLVQNLELRECLDWVAKQVDNKQQQPYVRATAMATLGKLGGKEVLPKLEGFFNDATQLTTFQQGNPLQMIRTEVRDVALAMAVMASGQDIVGYNYPWLVQVAPQLGQNPQIPFQSPFQLGFATAEQRDAAFKRYAEWKSKQTEPKKEEPKKEEPKK